MRAAMLEHGFDVYPEPDGQIHRFKGPGDKNLNGWYVFHGDHGAIGKRALSSSGANIANCHRINGANC